MASIEKIVKVTIAKGTRQVSQPGFGIGLILAPYTNNLDRFRTYESFEDLSADFVDGDPVYEAGLAYFGQEVKPSKLVVGRIVVADSETAVTAIQAVQALNDEWYAVMYLGHVKADVLALAAWIETQKKILGTSSQDVVVVGTGTTDVAYALKAASYSRTWPMYSAEADSKYPEAAWMGRMLPTGVGAATWKFKTLAGITVDNLSSTAITNSQGKNCNIYIPMGGVNIMAEGIMADGEYIDTIRGIDWLQLTMEANVYSLLVNSDKVPFTDKGIAVVENAVRQTLQEGVVNGLLAEFTVSVPKVSEVSTLDKASRTLNNVVFTAVLAGAIHKVNIQGYVSV